MRRKNSCCCPFLQHGQNCLCYHRRRRKGVKRASNNWEYLKIQTMKNFLILCSVLLCVFLMHDGDATAAAESEKNTGIDMKELTILKGNGREEIEGGIVTETGEILLYGWTSSTMWEGISYTSTFPSYRDALAVMVSPEGEIQWITTDGDARDECMCSFVGAAIIDDRIVLCHCKVLDYTWKRVFGITVMDHVGNILKKYDFEDDLVVQDTCGTDSTLLLCGSYVQGEYWVPFIYAIASSGERLWEYTDQPASWRSGEYTEGVFKSVAGNDKGITIGVLSYGTKQVHLIRLDSTGVQVHRTTMDGIMRNEAWLSDEYYGIYGYTLDSFVISYADLLEHQQKKIIEPQPIMGNDKIVRLLESSNSIYYLITRNMIPIGIFRADQQSRIGLHNPYPNLAYTGGAVSEENGVVILWGTTWESQPENRYAIITRGTIPMQ